MDRQQEFVLRTIEERDVRFVRLWFTDVVGSLKSVALSPAEVEGAFSEGLGFDGSSIEGLSRVFESDMLLKPDPSSFQILPWRGEEEPTSRMFCDVLTPDQEPAAGDPRWVLRRQLEPPERWASPATRIRRSSSTCSTRRSPTPTVSCAPRTVPATSTTSPVPSPRTCAARRSTC